MTPSRRDALAVAAVALAARVGVIVWADGKFPPVEDGHYYDILARRLASGAGYTWLWPDGAVTYAAHYPVGYPAMLALAYALAGAVPWLGLGLRSVGMGLNAVVGALGAYGAHRVSDGARVPRWRPFAAGLCVALHPALVFYTPAVMTEGVTASLLLVAGALACGARSRGNRRRWGWVAAAGAAVGVATLVRPPSLLLGPVLGVLAVGRGRSGRQRLMGACLATCVALACVLPWTARNCVRMRRCALVSVNGGWNLLIGAQTASGGWAPVDVPGECATVWDEAAKDACFQSAAEREIARAPVAWLARAPAKVAMTLDSIGAAGWYLHASNASAFGEASKAVLGAAEALTCRLLLLAALAAIGTAAGPRCRTRAAVATGGALTVFTVHGWMGYGALAACIGLLGRRRLWAAPPGVGLGGAVVVATIGIHAIFFGAGRYGLIAVPFVPICAFGMGRGGLRRVLARAGSAVQIGPRRRRSGDRRRGSRIPRAPREESPSSTEHDAG